MNRGATRTGVDQADSRSTASTAGGAARTSTATAQLTECSLSSKLGHLMMRHGSRHLSTFGALKSFRGFKFQKGPPKLPAILPEAAGVARRGGYVGAKPAALAHIQFSYSEENPLTAMLVRLAAP